MSWLKASLRQDLLCGQGQPVPNEVLGLCKDKGANFRYRLHSMKLEKVMAPGVQSGERISFWATPSRKSKAHSPFLREGRAVCMPADSEPTCATSPRRQQASQNLCTHPADRLEPPLLAAVHAIVRLPEPTWPWICLVLARELGLEAYGISFHVGSQQRDSAPGMRAIAKVKVEIFERLKERRRQSTL